jgi:hypothetical protein
MSLRRPILPLALFALAGLAAAPALAQDTPAASQPAASQPAASQPAASQPAASQPAASQPAGDAGDTRVPAPPSGKGEVVFFRPFAAGFVLTFSVHEGDKGIVKLPSGTYFVYTADPGPHSYTIESEAKDTLNMEVDAGEVYYVKQTMGMGFFVGHPHINQSDAADFAKYPKLKVSTATPTDKSTGKPGSAPASDKAPGTK